MSKLRKIKVVPKLVENEKGKFVSGFAVLGQNAKKEDITISVAFFTDASNAIIEKGLAEKNFTMTIDTDKYKNPDDAQTYVTTKKPYTDSKGILHENEKLLHIKWLSKDIEEAAFESGSEELFKEVDDSDDLPF